MRFVLCVVIAALLPVSAWGRRVAIPELVANAGGRRPGDSQAAAALRP